jgi:hypothetical protein
MDRIEFIKLDTEPKWALVRGWLEPLATFAMGKVKEDRGDENAIFSGTYLERPFRVIVGVDSATMKVQVRVNNQRGDLHVRLATRPLDPLPEADAEWDDRPPDVRHFLTPTMYLEERKDEMDSRIALLTGLIPGLIVQTLQTGADDVDITDESIEIGFLTSACDAPAALAGQMQTVLDLVNQIARELGA